MKIASSAWPWKRGGGVHLIRMLRELARDGVVTRDKREVEIAD